MVNNLVWWHCFYFHLLKSPVVFVIYILFIVIHSQVSFSILYLIEYSYRLNSMYLQEIRIIFVLSFNDIDIRMINWPIVWCRSHYNKTALATPAREELFMWKQHENVILKVIPILKKMMQIFTQVAGQCQYCRVFQKCLKSWFPTNI